MSKILLGPTGDLSASQAGARRLDLRPCPSYRYWNFVHTCGRYGASEYQTVF